MLLGISGKMGQLPQFCERGRELPAHFDKTGWDERKAVKEAEAHAEEDRKTKEDIEIRNKAIKSCIKSKEFNANKMFEYAKKMKIYEKVKNYMEAII